MTTSPLPIHILKRTVSSLAAIAAVCVIFGAKAMEVERRTVAGSPQIAMTPESGAPAGVN